MQLQCEFAIELVNQFPEQRFVLDHLAKPIIREGLMEPWGAQIRELAGANATPKLAKTFAHTIEAVVDRIVLKPEIRSRLAKPRQQRVVGIDIRPLRLPRGRMD